MVRRFASIAFAGALVIATAPAFAQDVSTNPLGLPIVPNSVNLDPFHLFTPAPPPPAPAPAAAPMKMHHHHHMMMHHKHMMMHHKKMMMHHKMMKKTAMKKKAAKKM